MFNPYRQIRQQFETGLKKYTNDDMSKDKILVQCIVINKLLPTKITDYMVYNEIYDAQSMILNKLLTAESVEHVLINKPEIWNLNKTLHAISAYKDFTGLNIDNALIFDEYLSKPEIGVSESQYLQENHDTVNRTKNKNDKVDDTDFFPKYTNTIKLPQDFIYYTTFDRHNDFVCIIYYMHYMKQLSYILEEKYKNGIILGDYWLHDYNEDIAKFTLPFVFKDIISNRSSDWKHTYSIKKITHRIDKKNNIYIDFTFPQQPNTSIANIVGGSLINLSIPSVPNTFTTNTAM
ncbi:MAG: hypothetical protein EOP34_03130 [Rickettsiales bacterium]|nr:MAG: hypothetical protein EOP34_03130 [Rickettsiales bacterium]